MHFYTRIPWTLTVNQREHEMLNHAYAFFSEPSPLKSNHWFQSIHSMQWYAAVEHVSGPFDCSIPKKKGSEYNISTP